jgi:formylglycine-generating enzyme required for sulfatase activity
MRFKMGFTTTTVKNTVICSAISILILLHAVSCNDSCTCPDTSDPVNSTIPMVVVSSGQFQMGDGNTDCGVDIHEVHISRDYMLGTHEVTNQEYVKLLQWAFDDSASNLIIADSMSVRDFVSNEELLDLDDTDCRISFADSQFVVDTGLEYHPVVQVSWFGAACFCNWLSLYEGFQPAYSHYDWRCSDGEPYEATGYRLPLDAEWEHAASFNDDRSYPWGNDSPNTSSANFGYNENGPLPVGSYPNAPATIGLEDMAGNVWEWCNDWFTCSLGTQSVTDPIGPQSGTRKLLRGGSWINPSNVLQCSYRESHDPPSSSHNYTGFRVARTSPR